MDNNDLAERAVIDATTSGRRQETPGTITLQDASIQE